MSTAIQADRSRETREGVTGRQNRSRMVMAGLAAAVLAAGAVGFGLHQRGLDAPSLVEPDTTYTLHPLDPADTSFTLGSIYLPDHGADVQIVSVTPVRSTNLDYLGAFTVWPQDQGDSRLGAGPGFPSPRQPHRHELGETIPAADTNATAPISVNVGFRFRSGDIGLVNGVEVTYKVGDQVKHLYVAHAVLACVQPRICRPSAGQSDTAFRAEVTRDLRFTRG